MQTETDEQQQIVPSDVTVIQSQACSDAWSWVAEYTDGELFHEYDEQGEGRGFASIDQSRLARFILLPQRDGLPVHVLTVEPDTRPIFFRRRVVNHDLETDEQTLTGTIHCLGWQSTVNGANVQSFTFYLEDGSTVVSSDRNAV